MKEKRSKILQFLCGTIVVHKCSFYKANWSFFHRKIPKGKQKPNSDQGKENLWVENKWKTTGCFMLPIHQLNRSPAFHKRYNGLANPSNGNGRNIETLAYLNEGQSCLVSFELFWAALISRGYSGLRPKGRVDAQNCLIPTWKVGFVSHHSYFILLYFFS